MRRLRVKNAAVILAAGLVMVACASGSSPEAESPPSSTSEGSIAESGSSSTSDTPATPADGAACAPTVGAAPLTESDPTRLSRLYDADGVTVDGALYPHPDYAGNPWSQWGQGIVGQDGRFYSAIGDQLGADGNSYVYEFDPSTNELTLITDVLTMVEHSAGAWGYGKIHAQMSLGPCGEIFYSTYWGSRRGLDYANGYEGDILFSIDTAGRTVVNRGVPQAERGFPTMASAPQHGLLYTIAVEPVSNAGTFLALDAVSGEVVFSTPSEVGYRSIAVDRAGRAYFTDTPGELAVYDPTSNTLAERFTLPGEFIRAADTLPDGSIVGVTQRPNVFFKVDANGLTTWNEAGGYTTSISLGPDAEEFFYLPGAHGDASVNGAILKAVDAASGAERDVIALAPIVEDGLGVILGGTYNLVMDPDANRIYLGANVDPTGSGNGFGEVALLVITLP